MSTSTFSDPSKNVPSPEVCEKILREQAFVDSFEEMQADAYSINVKNGFSCDLLIDEFEDWFMMMTTGEYGYADTPARGKFKPIFDMFRNARVGLKLALVMSELGETLEAVRKNLGPDSHIPEFTSEEAEVADAVIRLMNYAKDRKLRLAEAIVAKNEFNRNREDHSKEGRAAVHGKRF